MKYEKEIADYWEKFKKKSEVTGDFQDAWGFGDNPELMDELLELVLEGKKRASTTLIKEMEIEGYPKPEVGAYNIILNGSGKLGAITKTTSVREVKFRDVDEEQAYWEGEDDRTLEAYRREHIKYYERRGQALGFEFNEDMMVILERFKVVYP
jgi:uncharacterized protein YhfF